MSRAVFDYVKEFMMAKNIKPATYIIFGILAYTNILYKNNGKQDNAIAKHIAIMDYSALLTLLYI